MSEKDQNGVEMHNEVQAWHYILGSNLTAKPSSLLIYWYFSLHYMTFSISWDTAGWAMASLLSSLIPLLDEVSSLWNPWAALSTLHYCCQRRTSKREAVTESTYNQGRLWMSGKFRFPVPGGPPAHREGKPTSLWISSEADGFSWYLTSG